jgi:hypothetical protein
MKSMTAAILVVFTGYAVASYGYVLLRGWDITFKQWINPLDAFSWSGFDPTTDLVPSGQVFPSGP